MVADVSHHLASDNCSGAHIRDPSVAAVATAATAERRTTLDSTPHAVQVVVKSDENMQRLPHSMGDDNSNSGEQALSVTPNEVSENDKHPQQIIEKYCHPSAAQHPSTCDIGSNDGTCCKIDACAQTDHKHCSCCVQNKGENELTADNFKDKTCACATTSNHHTTKSTKDDSNRHVKFQDVVTVHYTETHYDGRQTYPMYDIRHWINHQPTHYGILLLLAMVLAALIVIEITQWNATCNRPIQYLFMSNIGAVAATMVLLSSFIVYRHLKVIRKLAQRRLAGRSIVGDTMYIPDGTVHMASSPRTAQRLMSSMTVTVPGAEYDDNSEESQSPEGQITNTEAQKYVSLKAVELEDRQEIWSEHPGDDLYGIDGRHRSDDEIDQRNGDARTPLPPLDFATIQEYDPTIVDSFVLHKKNLPLTIVHSSQAAETDEHMNKISGFEPSRSESGTPSITLEPDIATTGTRFEPLKSGEHDNNRFRIASTLRNIAKGVLLCLWASVHLWWLVSVYAVIDFGTCARLSPVLYFSNAAFFALGTVSICVQLFLTVMSFRY